MAIDRYDHYGKPRLTVTDKGDAYLIRNVLTEDGNYAGICEYAVYSESLGETFWHVCRKDVEFSEIRPFLSAPKGDV